MGPTALRRYCREQSGSGDAQLCHRKKPQDFKFGPRKTRPATTAYWLQSCVVAFRGSGVVSHARRALAKKPPVVDS